jgi:hypothetical protein
MFLGKFLGARYHGAFFDGQNLVQHRLQMALSGFEIQRRLSDVGATVSDTRPAWHSRRMPRPEPSLRQELLEARAKVQRQIDRLRREPARAEAQGLFET